MIVNDVGNGVPVGSLAALAFCALLVVAACEAPPPTAIQSESEPSADVLAESQQIRGAEAATVRLVGPAVTGDETPLIYLDGVRIRHALTDLDPESIDRIEVIKGGAALARFGEEAAAGVIQIFLKPDAEQSTDGQTAYEDQTRSRRDIEDRKR